MSNSETRRVPVWDLPTRLFHWLLVAAVVTSWASAEAGNFKLHFLSGYTILGLVAFRLLWGLVGFPTARFSQFVKGPRAVAAYLRYRLGRDHTVEPPLGHNPLGGWMVVALLVLLVTQGSAGLFTSDDILVDGPLVAYASAKTVALLSTVHRLTFTLIAALVATHVTAVVAYLVVWRENLVRPMLTGWKPAPESRKP